MHTIPKYWGLNLSRKLNPVKLKQKCLEKVIAATKVNKMVYQNLMGQEKNTPVRNHEPKWEKFWRNIEDKKWKKIYGVNFESCVEKSLRAFQYSILLRTVPRNKYVMQCNLVNTDKFSFNRFY